MAKQITQKFCAILYICISLHAPLYGAEGATIESKPHHNTHTTKRKKKKRSRTWAKIAGVSVATAMTASFLYMLMHNGSSKKTMLPAEIPAQGAHSVALINNEALPIQTSTYDKSILGHLFFHDTGQLCNYIVYSKINGHWSSIIEFVEQASLSLEQKLLVHVLHQDHTTCRQLIEAKADVNYSPKNCFSALHIATYKSDEKMVTLLVEAKADVNKACNNLYLQDGTLSSSASNTKPMYHAFRPTYNKSILQCLVKAKAEINQPVDCIHKDALSLAIWDQRSDAVQYLLEHKADLHKKYHYSDQSSIIHICAIKPNVNVMKLLIDAGATPDQQSIDLLARKNQDHHNTADQKKNFQPCLELLSAIPQA